jgi:thiosulfate/3-mercaptopyruvate sulfurtransferase
MLKWMGHEAVAVLDGGLQAWQALGGAIDSLAADAGLAPDSTLGSEQKYPLAPALIGLVATKTIADQLGRASQCIIDARAAPRFRGEVEPLDPVAGHIPGALNRPFGLNFDSEGKFKPATVLRQEFEQLLAGRDPASVVHHCGSGVSAVPNVIAMEIAGLGSAGLYAGSWSEWCSDASRPVARG